MYILYAPYKTFGELPSGTPLFHPDITFTGNVASTNSKYWRDFATTKGVVDITPKTLRVINKKRKYTNVLFLCLGGIGDILWSTPVIAEWKKNHPHAKITVSASREYFSLFAHNPHIHNLTFLPPQYMPLIFYIFDEIFDFGGAVVGNPEEKTRHAIDLYFDKLQIPLPLKIQDRAAKIYITDVEKALLFLFLQSKGIKPKDDPIAIVNTDSSAPIRTYPFGRSKIIAEGLANQGFKVFLVGKNREILRKYSHICVCDFYFDMSSETEAKTIIYTCPKCGKSNFVAMQKLNDNIIPMIGTVDLRFISVLISQADIFIGPDSGLLQIAAATSTPSVGLYGPIPARLRTKYYEKHITIEGACPQKRCFKHKPECPISTPSPCLKDIPPEMVYNEAYKLFEKYRKDKGAKWSGLEKLLADEKLQKLGKDFSRIFAEKALTSVVEPINLIHQRLGLTDIRTTK